VGAYSALGLLAFFLGRCLFLEHGEKERNGEEGRRRRKKSEEEGTERTAAEYGGY